MQSKNINKILGLFLIVFPVYLLYQLSSTDRVYFLCPINYKTDFQIRYDSRGNGEFAASRNGKRIHEGLDFLARIGSPVMAVKSGKVIEAGFQRGLGHYIEIRHPDNLITIYGHLLERAVVENQFVRQGQIIGKVGKTGNANHPLILPHLHFEVRKNGLAQDPLDYLE